jgi:hypothetical protein
VTETVEPRPAMVPPNGARRFQVVLEGIGNGDLMHAWSDLCQPAAEPPADEFKAVYPYVTTVQGNSFRFRGGDPSTMRDNLQRLFQKRLRKPVKAHIE